MRTALTFVCLGLITMVCPCRVTADEQLQRLWTVGTADNDFAEFALAPKSYGEFADDGFFVVGKSDTRQNWPFVHPGPDDGWAGGRSHTFTIAFGLQQAPTEGSGRLVLDFVDTQNAIPPRLRIEVNGYSFEHATPRGAGDASVYGDATAGREHLCQIEFPAEALREGNNLISVTTLSGSWVLYDCIGLDVSSSTVLGEPQGTLVRRMRTEPRLMERDGELFQTVSIDVLHFGDPGSATVHLPGAEPVELALTAGVSTVDVPVPAVDEATELAVRVTAGEQTLATDSLTLQPVRRWVVYLLPHSHVDIGYTHVQTDVEHSHWQFYEQAIQAARETADYPPGAQFKWNVEVLWATDSYLQQATEEKRREFLEAVYNGWVGLDALYGNQLTALCRPEELIRLVEYGNQLKREHHVPIDSAMISDVPGYTWGLVSVLAESGVKYFSIGPNGGHRIGYTLSEYGDKPFWWRSPCGRHRVLCWIPRTGYWRGFRGEAGLMSLLQQMEKADYPYDLVQIRHCLGDNAGPGLELSDFVKQWNEKYAYPKLVIATTSEMMRELEQRYGEELPELTGDFTPYWEDGAASSAQETALNRAAAERLVQAETLFALLQPNAYPRDEFYEAWRNVILYDEHTWGAHCSISEPESDFTKAQWAIKQKFALDADQQSRELLRSAVSTHAITPQTVSVLDVFNTSSWPRTDLVVLPAAMQLAGDRVSDEQGHDVVTQRLASGDLALLAVNVPALGAKRFTFQPGDARSDLSGIGPATAEGATLANSAVNVTLDEQTGAITQLTWEGHNFVLPGDDQAPQLNDYYYVAGRQPDNPQRNGPVQLVVEDRGPLVATISVTSAAPGCHSLQRKVRVIAGLDRVELVNLVDKENIYEPEGVHFAFPFNVPEGTVRLDLPWAVARVEEDQLPGSCKNYLTAQRWADVANDQRGITLATIDAPLLEVGGITCDPVAVGWIKQLEPSQTLYSYVMNNYWETNYKAGQEGPTTFRYALQPHGPYDAVQVQRFGTERSQPLLAVPVNPETEVLHAPLSVVGDGVVLTCLKPSDDSISRKDLPEMRQILQEVPASEQSRAVIVRLFNTLPFPAQARLQWRVPLAEDLQLCDLAERPKEPAPQTLELAPYQFVTLRAVIEQ